MLATGDGAIAAVTVEVGGFLGINERDVVINLDSIRLDGLRLTLDMSREQIRSLPEWDD
ncbi:PRC-barrel domain-containing protein [Nitratireductor luteus]|uniref:PRC-barrel domain-containing protein n=1 Tax=Nitratireductor luteus TaxID=2976980 RepID=UPI00223F367D|nr:PRC-barrel domain-containing protein [Nitratireductor luteus]